MTLSLLIYHQSSSSYGRLAFSVAGPAIWTGYQTVWEIQPSAKTSSSFHWRRFYFQLTHVHSALELCWRCALPIYLLTYFHFQAQPGLCWRHMTITTRDWITYVLTYLLTSVSKPSLACA